MDDFIVQKHQNIFFVCVYEDNVFITHVLVSLSDIKLYG